jgi:hypothetical protein
MDEIDQQQQQDLSDHQVHCVCMVIVPSGEGHGGQPIRKESLTPDRSDRPERYHHHIIVLCVIAYRICIVEDKNT